MVCYILGGNPPLSTLDGFARCVWKDKINKVGMLSYGIFLICFDSVEDRDQGENSLFKIISQVGKPLMVDSITKIRDKLSYPRVLIEVSLKQDFPDLIWFEDEHGFNTSVAVTYEWKPVSCDHCKGMGHDTSACRRKEGRKPEWVVKDTEKATGLGETMPELNKDMTSSLNIESIYDPDGFKPATKVWKVKAKDPPVNTSVANSFQALIEPNGSDLVQAENKEQQSQKLMECTSQLINLGVATVDNKNSFFVTYVYAFNDEEGRKRLWKELQDLSVMGPWIVMGDFNDILAKEERIGNRVRYKSSTDFIECVANCQLEDVKYSGNLYTWCNKQHGEDRIYSKIDRVLANQIWLSLFPDAEAVFFEEGLFDHTPAVLTVYSNVPCGRKPFKYFKMWSTHPKYFEKVKLLWQQQVTGTKMYRVITKLKALKAVFKEINAQGYSDITSA
ncbi:uncharacterized protein LOC133833020 [Humulus lupulus]|uniref:uncharacterized protein LOC133833020 n=1 Tax=Humulus lupulus TaxID=3486 RepID=UPI002B408552|nr:uncharacterized protein LOC133833020 [Humulus lupulus]